MTAVFSAAAVASKRNLLLNVISEILFTLSSSFLCVSAAGACDGKLCEWRTSNFLAQPQKADDDDGTSTASTA